MAKKKQQLIVWIQNIYWFVPLILFSFQAVFTFHSMSQIRYEELAESVRNVYWLEHHLVYDGISTNIGWYGLLLVVYKLFGFSLFSAKFVRLGLHLISLYALAAILKEYLGKLRALVPLAVIALSPTLLFLNILQTSYGMDLQYLPICLYLVMATAKLNGILKIVVQALFGILVMIAAMSYPPFVFYIPFLIVIYIWSLKKEPKRASGFPTRSAMTRNVVGSSLFLLGLLLPLILSVHYVHNRQTLLADPRTHSGLFRGNGTITINPDTFGKSLAIVASDLFDTGVSYHFDIAKAEFSDLYPLLSIISVAFLSFYLLKRNKPCRPIIGIGLSLLVFGLIISLMTSSDPSLAGIRRSTSVLVGFYSLYTLAWYGLSKRILTDQGIKFALIAALVLLPVHHLVVYFENLDHLSIPSAYAETMWFKLDQTPTLSFKRLTDKITQADLPLVCKNRSDKIISCRYNEVFTAIEGWCTWNKQPCHTLLGFDPKTDKLVPLSLDLWNDYYWEH